jgi:hypothetical protein
MSDLFLPRIECGSCEYDNKHPGSINGHIFHDKLRDC